MKTEETKVIYSRPEMTIDEYLHFENSTIEKNEYHQGHVYARGLCNITHNTITCNTLGEIAQFLKPSSYSLYGSGFRIFVEDNSFFTYPDLSIFSEEVTTLDNDEMNATNPCVLIEVLSRITRNYDQGLKFELYQGIKTLKEYILIDSENIYVKAYTIKPKGVWEPREHINISDSLLIQTIQMNLPLQKIYHDAKLL